MNTPQITGEWKPRQALQVDSFATGKQQAGMSYILGNQIRVEVTDGTYTWVGFVDLPPDWKK